MKAYLFLAAGFEEIEAITPMDVLRRADIQLTTVSITNSLWVAGAHHITIEADALFTDLDFNDADLLVLPGGMPGTTNLNNYHPLLDLILKHYSKGKTIGAICAAPLILGKLGLLNNRDATCYPGYEIHLKGANIIDEAVVRSSQIITSKGAGTALEFSLELVAILTSAKKTHEIASKMIAKTIEIV